MLTQDRLKELLHYCPETGVFTWLVSGNGRRKGAEAGTAHRNIISGKSYREVQVFGHKYQAHRLSFLYMTGEFPVDQVDHIDGNGLNNIWTNLRPVTFGENQKNRRKYAHNTSGTTGVYWNVQCDKWVSQIVVEGKSKYLGYFHNKEDAIAARKAADVLYGFHENHGTERPL